MSSSKTPERPARTDSHGDNVPNMSAHQYPPLAANENTVGGISSSSAAGVSATAVTPSPQVVNRARDRASSNPPTAAAVAAAAKGTRLDFADPSLGRANNANVAATAQEVNRKEMPSPPSTPKRHHTQQQKQTTVDDLMIQRKKARLLPPPKPTEMQTFKSHTAYPQNKDLSTEDQIKALSHLRTHCFCAETLHLKTNDLVVTTQSLGDNVPVGTPGKVVGWTSIEDIRLGLGTHIQELRSSPSKGGEHQQEYEIDVTHKHAVDVMPCPWYPDVLFQGIHEEEEGTVLPEAFADIVPGVGTMMRCQLPLLRIPHCRCRPAAPAKLLRCHNHGPNHGRWFFGCARPIGQQCGYFVWKTSKQGGVKKEEPK